MIKAMVVGVFVLLFVGSACAVEYMPAYGSYSTPMMLGTHVNRSYTCDDIGSESGHNYVYNELTYVGRHIFVKDRPLNPAGSRDYRVHAMAPQHYSSEYLLSSGGWCNVVPETHYGTKTLNSSASSGSTALQVTVIFYDSPGCTNSWVVGTAMLLASPTPHTMLTISGDTYDLDYIELFIKHTNGNYYMVNGKVLSTSDDYSFNFFANYDYRIIDSDGGKYDFNTTVNVDYDSVQPNTVLTLYDDCGNLLDNPTTTIFTNNVEQIYQGTDNPITIYEAGNYDRYDKFNVVIDTHDMAVEKVVYADDENNTFNLYHNNVDWDLQTIVYDNDTKDELEGVKVSINQECRINGYPTYTYGLTNAYGFVSSAQLSNQNFTVECEKSGYKDYSSSFVSNFDAQVSTYLVEIYLDNTSSEYDGNQTIPEAPCSTAWSNNSNVVIHEINSSEDARLHYMAGDCTTLLYLERWSDAANMWLIVGSSITLDPLETGYIQYTTANWTEGETTLYRGRLWALHCYCDDTSTLKVWDTSDNNQTTFENLTANVQFKNKLSGHQVDPEKAIIIYAYAASNNTSLCNIDLELYNESTKVEDIALTFFDWYISSTFTTYKWYPTYEYAEGYNYTVKMIGFNDALLDIDTVFANTSSGSPFDPKNTLTVIVKDHHGNPLTYSTVFIEGWGSQASHNSDTVTIAGLSDGDVQYKTTKSGYIASIWQTVTFSGADESVECILIKDSLTIGKGLKMTDSKIKSFLIPGLYLLLILILVGGVTNANKR